MKTMTPAEYRKAKLPERNETQMLLAVNSRYEDMGGKRIHIMPDLEEPILIQSRNKTEGLYVPTAGNANDLDVLKAYGAIVDRALWVRPPFILPSSWAPWNLESGRQYWLARSVLSTPYPAGSSRQAHWDWCLENINLHPTAPFLPHALPEDFSQASDSDIAEANVRLWHDGRGPSAERRGEIQSILFAATMRGEGVEGYAPILPTDRSQLTQPPVPSQSDGKLTFAGWEEAVWAAMLDDPDLGVFALDPDESEDPDETMNLFIESDNLLALKRLRRGYDGKVKLTYADPPYNTGNKFVYNDNFQSGPNTGSPFLGQRFGRGTWLACMCMPWVNACELLTKPLVPVDDELVHVDHESKKEAS